MFYFVGHKTRSKATALNKVQQRQEWAGGLDIGEGKKQSASDIEVKKLVSW